MIFFSASTTVSGGLGYFSRATSTTAMTFTAGKFYYLELQRSSDNLSTIIYGTTASSSFSTYGTANGIDVFATTTPYFQIQTERTDANSVITGNFNPQVIETLPCGITDLTGCVKNAIAWAFVPDTTTWDLFIDLGNGLKTKPPFGHLSAAFTAISGLNGSSTPAFALSEDSAIMTYIFTPLRSGLVWVMLLAALVWLYKHLKEVPV